MAVVRRIGVRTFAEVVADRSPTRRDEWPVCSADDARLAEITVEQWFDRDAVMRYLETWRRTGQHVTCSLVVATRVWADDMIVDEWVNEDLSSIAALSVPGCGHASGYNAAEAAARRFDRRGPAGQPRMLLFCNWDADRRAVRPLSTDESPTFVMQRTVAGVASLVLCTITDLTADESAEIVAGEIHLITRLKWRDTESGAPTAEEKAAARDFVIRLYEHDEAIFRYAVNAWSADAKEDRDRARRGRRPRRRAPIEVPMYMLAGRGRTKPVDLPQRVVAKALLMLGFGEAEIAAEIGAARERLGRAVGDAADRGIAGAQLRRELGDTRDWCAWLERELAAIPRARG
jgi:hypothetical protein